MSKDKVIFDNIYGYMTIPKLCLQIIDTPEFQRLRHIKQLGVCQFVYPGANHSRFEHSIGVCYLIGELFKNIQSNQPNLQLDYRKILLVQIGGLCHDLGHGPYSHLFDDIFLPKAYASKTWNNNKDLDKPRFLVQEPRFLVHEYRSQKILEHIIQKYQIQITQEELEFINKTIIPTDDCKDNFYFQIVCNKVNDLDLDKLDYLNRDINNIGLSYSLDYSRLLKQARIIDGKLCFLDKTVFTINDLFSTRYRLHKEIYQHKVVKAIEGMILDVLLLIDPIFKISDSINNIEEYCKITDHIITQIEYGSEALYSNLLNDNPDYRERFQQAQSIIRNIKTRKLYKLVGQKTLKDSHKYVESDFISPDNNLTESDLYVINITLGYTGKSNKNPIDLINFYKLDNPNKIINIKHEYVSLILPENYLEHRLMVFCKDPTKVKIAKEVFNSIFR